MRDRIRTVQLGHGPLCNNTINADVSLKGPQFIDNLVSGKIRVPLISA